MTAKELIEKLQMLDPEANVWIVCKIPEGARPEGSWMMAEYGLTDRAILTNDPRAEYL